MVRARNWTCVHKHRARWAVAVRKANYSAFNGGRRTSSDYSLVRCAECGRRWRTKAAYVDTLPDFNPDTDAKGAN